MKFSLLTTFILLSVLTTNGQIQFEGLSFSDAIAKARAEHKFVFVDFRADWCKPCIDMEKTTFQDTSIGNYLDKKAISLKIDVDQVAGKKIKDRYQVNQYPTILIINPLDSSVQLRMIGFKPAYILLGDLKFAMEEIDANDSKSLPHLTLGTAKKSNKKHFLKRWFQRSTAPN